MLASMLVRGLTTRKKLVRSLKSSSIIFIVSFFSSRFFLSDIAFVLHHPTWQSDTERSSDSMRPPIGPGSVFRKYPSIIWTPAA